MSTILKNDRTAKRTRCRASRVRQEHPRNNLVRHPRPQALHHRRRPLSRTCRQHVRLYVLVPYACDNGFVAVEQPKRLKRAPYLLLLRRKGGLRFGFGGGKSGCAEGFEATGE